MKNLKLFPLHTGVWRGTYTRIAADGSIIHQHASELTLRLNGSIWHQTNRYTFLDGREEFHDFGECPFNEEGVLIFDNPRILGKAWETEDSIVLEWQYKNEPGSQLYEIINLLGDGHRMRVWQHARNGVFEGLTMIEERRVKTQAEI
jgi:Domain of unknown function (DUF3598)